MTKRYEELTFTDDFMFCKIMMNNEDLCRELTELIIGKKIGGVITVDKQMPIEIAPDGRGVRFDIYMKDDTGTVYNIEMQAGSVKEIPLRTRYYQGMIDLNLIERGAMFSELKNSFIIFICLDNLFPEIGLHKYSFSTICEEQRNLKLGDGSHKIILSAKGSRDDVSEGLKSFLSYIAGNVPDSDLTKRLDDLVGKARRHVEWRKEYMTLLERDERMREEGRKEERENTAREKARADEAEQRAERAERQIEWLNKQLESRKITG